LIALTRDLTQLTQQLIKASGDLRLLSLDPIELTSLLTPLTLTGVRAAPRPGALGARPGRLALAALRRVRGAPERDCDIRSDRQLRLLNVIDLQGDWEGRRPRLAVFGGPGLIRDVGEQSRLTPPHRHRP